MYTDKATYQKQNRERDVIKTCRHSPEHIWLGTFEHTCVPNKN